MPFIFYQGCGLALIDRTATSPTNFSITAACVHIEG
jgi:hypothetical protein